MQNEIRDGISDVDASAKYVACQGFRLIIC